jgi:hypothetical protein
MVLPLPMSDRLKALLDDVKGKGTGRKALAPVRLLIVGAPTDRQATAAARHSMSSALVAPTGLRHHLIPIDARIRQLGLIQAARFIARPRSSAYLGAFATVVFWCHFDRTLRTGRMD